ncbi:hypothetical protein [Methanobrevibacter sp.]|uniref:hypothetical protein n=1 Tax=Methanobrevibacter sp. TaxID=66852 RepID=UPI00388FA9E5
MKKLYALLVILIVIYVGINVAADNIPFVSNNPFGNSTESLKEIDTGNITENITESTVSVGASNFRSLDNFSDSFVNDTTISLVDNNSMTIYVSEIDNSQSIENIYNSFIANNQHTSTQTIDQNGVSTYFVYDTGSESYNANIFFNKNGQNYQITGNGIPLSNSDYFINHCKTIIDTIDITSSN